jgi:hypothetical protein
MTMNYQKMTIPMFQQRLKEGAYKGITGARRAIGKADWGQKERDEAHVLANKHFKMKEGVRPSKPASAGRVDSRPRAAASSRASAPAASRAADGQAPPKAASTNAEILELCGAANELVETIRKSAELSTSSRPVLDDAVAVLFRLLQNIEGAFKGNRAGARAVAKSVSQLAASVRPQSYVARRGDEDGQAEAAAGGR